MKAKPGLSNTYIVLILIFLYLPILAVILYSFNTSKFSAVWDGFTLDWYVQMIADNKLMDALWISVQVAAATAAISAVLGTVGALSVPALGNKLRTLLNGLMYIPVIIPEIVMGVSLLMFFSVLGASFGKWTLIISHTVFCIPYIYILVGIRLRAIEKSVTEAARDLGAKPLYVFFTVTLPLVAPAIISGSLLSLAMSLDDVVISIFVSGPRSQTLPVTIYSMLKLGVTPKINALCTVIFLFSFAAVSCVQIIFLKKNREE